MVSLGRGVRRLVWRQVRSLGPRSRFMALRIAIWLGQSVDVNVLRELAAELESIDATEWAKWCWRVLHRLVPFDPEILMGRLATLVANGEINRVRSLVGEARRNAGFPPARVIWLSGTLAEHGFRDEAGEFLHEFTSLADGGERLIQQSPSLMSPHVLRDLRRLVTELRDADRENGGAGEVDPAQVELARLCFTFGNLGTAAALYRQVETWFQLSWLDRIAMRYTGARTGVRTGDGEELAGLLKAAAGNPDALAMLSYTALADNDEALAYTALELAIRIKYAGAARLGEILQDGMAILGVIASLRNVETPFPVELIEFADRSIASDVPKVFVCGFGWSGSGAVYDDIRAVGGFCEFEGPGQDPILNEDSETEVTFIQSTAGLGDLWMGAKYKRSVGWSQLWDLFCMHVVGLAPIGYSNYKSCAAATNHVHRYGTLYSGPFRRFFEGYAALLQTPAQGGLLSLLQETTEKLCAMLVVQNNGKAVLFNNAIFGRDVEMLEIFRACHAVAVFRDPLDVYADRKNKDKNHWRTPRQLAEFYGRGLRRYLDYRNAAGRRVGATLREIPFERFVLEPGFRWRVRAWLLPGLEDTGGSHFDPAVSSRNIGLHRDTVDAHEAEQLRPAMAAYREMRQLSMNIWGA